MTTCSLTAVFGNKLQSSVSSVNTNVASSLKVHHWFWKQQFDNKLLAQGLPTGNFLTLSATSSCLYYRIIRVSSVNWKLWKFSSKWTLCKDLFCCFFLQIPPEVWGGELSLLSISFFLNRWVKWIFHELVEFEQQNKCLSIWKCDRLYNSLRTGCCVFATDITVKAIAELRLCRQNVYDAWGANVLKACWAFQPRHLSRLSAGESICLQISSSLSRGLYSAICKVW